MKFDLLTSNELPQSFKYPPEYLNFINQNLRELFPWEIIVGDRLKVAFASLNRKYPSRRLVPFAVRRDCDDVACWDNSIDNKIVVIHDGADSGSELVGEYDNFFSWFYDVIKDMEEFEDYYDWEM